MSAEALNSSTSDAPSAPAKIVRAAPVPPVAAPAIVAARAPLRVVCIYPAFDPAINELAMVWGSLAASGQVLCRALAGSSDRLKNSEAGNLAYDAPNLSVRRVAGQLSEVQVADELIAWAAALKPDVIVCGNDNNLAVGQRIRQAAGTGKVVLHCEYWFDKLWLPRREFLGFEPLRGLGATWRRFRLSRQFDAVMVSNAGESDALVAAGHSDARCNYLPWPHPRSVNQVLPRDQRDLNRVVFIGSITQWKGARRLGVYFDALLRAVPTVTVDVIGPPLDDEARGALALLAKWGERARITPHVARDEALRRIGSALCVFAPGDRFGWGMVGDAFGTGTPAVGAVRQYELVDQKTALLCPHPASFVAAIQSLQADPVLWNRLAEAGLGCTETIHSVAAVQARLFDILDRLAQPA